MEEHRLPKYLRAQPQLLNWELDELMVWAPFVIVGLLINHMFLLSLVGYFVMRGYIKLKRNKQDGYLLHFFYKLGLYNLKGKVPEYWIKELVK